MTSAVIYFRSGLAEEDELDICKQHFDVVEQRTLVTGDYDLVIPRYSALPYYKELETDVIQMGSCLINSHKQHNYVADIRNWYNDLANITPETWFYLDQIPETGPFVLKGATNSKKFNWKTHMYAANRRDAITVYGRLCEDSMVGMQDICIRQYVPLKRLAMGLQGLPISEEYRFFVLNSQIVSSGFYWSNHWDEIEPKPDVNDVPQTLVDEVVAVVGPKINFFVFDVARTEDGSWILIELNDGQQSGLSMNNPDVLYSNMRRVLNGEQL